MKALKTQPKPETKEKPEKDYTSTHAWLQDCGCYYCGHCGVESNDPQAKKRCRMAPK